MTTSTVTGRLRMGRRLQWAVIAAIAAAAVACSTKDAPGPIGPTGPVGRVRFVNLIIDPADVPVNAILEGLAFGVNLAHGATTPASLPAPAAAFYSPIYVGARTLVLKRTGDTSVTVATINFTVAEDVDQTIYATGGAGAAAVVPFITTDVNPVPAATEVRFRVVNMTAGAIDVFFTATGADLATATPAVTVPAQTASAYFPLPPSGYQIRTVPAGTPAAGRTAAVNLTIAAPATPYAGGTARTIVVATSATGGTPLKGIVLGDR